MNPRHAPGFIVLAALLCAGSITCSGTSDANELVPMLDFEEVTLGDHRSVVARRLGDPPESFSADVWVYWDYRDPRRTANERYKTLVLVFRGDRLTHIRYTDTAATRAALVKYRHDQAIASLFLLGGKPLAAGDQAVAAMGADPELLVATNKARASIRIFLDAFTSPTPKQGSFRVKIAFVKDNTIEHLWLENIDLQGAKPAGTIATTPRRRDLRIHQRVEFDPSHLSDWMYVEDGKRVGGFTTDILHRRMTNAERSKRDAETLYSVTLDREWP